MLTFYSRYVIPEPDQYNDFFKPGLTRHFHSKWWTQSGIWRLSPHCFVVEPALWFVFRLYGLYALVVFAMFCCSCRLYSIIYFSNEIWYLLWAKVGFDLSSNMTFYQFWLWVKQKATDKQHFPSEVPNSPCQFNHIIILLYALMVL